MRKLFAAVVVALVVLSGAIATGCGQSDEEKREEARQEKAEKQRAKEQREQVKQQARFETCGDTFTELQDAVDELGSRLNIGLTYVNYTSEVADVRVVYDQTDFGAIDDFDCLGDVGVPLEKALNQYAKAATRWDECFEDIYCENDSIEGELQTHWDKAGQLALKADAGLAAMEPQEN